MFMQEFHGLKFYYQGTILIYPLPKYTVAEVQSRMSSCLRLCIEVWFLFILTGNEYFSSLCQKCTFYIASFILQMDIHS